MAKKADSNIEELKSKAPSQNIIEVPSSYSIVKNFFNFLNTVKGFITAISIIITFFIGIYSFGYKMGKSENDKIYKDSIKNMNINFKFILINEKEKWKSENEDRLTIEEMKLFFKNYNNEKK
ncbi:hypothetical protein ETU08_08220 [Apibacter muscae]|uniref:hypothetical protein n=1 Tax=Apibacter muscae TaxID=2509004 RepID=UPI0011AD75E9|nr:hypothetical protein [Apibacter muscae]TWP28820.1 hypothetical protein ETU08_08220 [Apibacter muscae]